MVVTDFLDADLHGRPGEEELLVLSSGEVGGHSILTHVLELLEDVEDGSAGKEKHAFVSYSRGCSEVLRDG